MTLIWTTPTLGPCSCKRGVARDNCPACEGTGRRIDFRALHARPRRCPSEALALTRCTGEAGHPGACTFIDGRTR